MRKRVLAGILITLVIFVVARRLSMNRPSEVKWKFDDVRITHMTVYEQVGPGQPEIILQVDPPTEIEAEFCIVFQDRGVRYGRNFRDFERCLVLQASSR